MELNYKELNKLIEKYGFGGSFQVILEDCVDLARWLNSFAWSETENGHDFWKQKHVKIHGAQKYSEDRQIVTNLPEVLDLLKKELANTKYVINKPKPVCYEI